MEGLEKYKFTYKDGRPLERFDLPFVVENVDDFTDELGHELKYCVDFEEIRDKWLAHQKSDNLIL